MALYEERRFQQAEVAARRLIQAYPQDAFGFKLLGSILAGDQRASEAFPLLERAVRLDPGDVESLSTLGVVLQDLGRSDAALACYREALRIQPGHAAALFNLAGLLGRSGQADAAVDLYLRLLQLEPRDAKTLNDLGALLLDLGRTREALDYFRRALSIRADFAEALTNAGSALRALGRLEEALAAHDQALKVKPESAAIRANLGTALQDQGRVEEAVATYREALRLRPQDLTIRSRLLFLENASGGRHPDLLLEAARQYGADAASRSRPYREWSNPPDPDRGLRVGLVSGDFRQHPVAYFLVEVLAALNRVAGEGLSLFGYCAFPGADAMTERIRSCCRGWSVVAGDSDAVLARRIHADGIDILIDLSGHTAHNRLPMFAWKPAPVQVTWLGYFATTGLAEMDYLLADETGVPPGHPDGFSERLWYLPATRLCFAPPDFDLPVSPLPALGRGSLTFGCFQHLGKLSDPALELWSRVFELIPGARFRFQNKALGDVATADRLRCRLMRHGIDPARVELQGLLPRQQYLAAHAEVDVILDTFPFTGGTTTCEALWMGVPTLTLAGSSLLSRQGASLLTAAGLSDWVAEDTDQYLAKAAALSSDLPRLGALRTELRGQVLQSPLFDAQGFAEELESALRAMWRLWVGRRKM